MRINQFEYLLALQRHGTFSRAAQELYVSQPSISVAVRELEEELGYTLLVRNKRGVTFTPEGLAVLEKAERIMGEINSLRRPAVGRQNGLSGSVSIGSTPHYCNALLTDVLYGLEKDQPDMTLEILARDSMNVIEMIRGKELDLGVVQLCDVDEDRLRRYIAAGELACVHLFSERLLMAAGEDHPLAGKTILDPIELEPYPYATFGHAVNRRMRELFEHFGWGDKIYCIGEVLALRRFIFRRDAVSMLPQSGLLYGNASCADAMVQLDIPCLDWEWECNVCLIRRWGDPTPQEAEVVRLLKDRCREFTGG